MVPGDDGQPLVGRGFARLGPRIRGAGGDLYVSPGGCVFPMIGGLSAWSPLEEAVAAVEQLPHLFPPSWGGTRSEFAMFAIRRRALPPGLMLVRKASMDGWTIQPAAAMPITQYEAMLGATRPRWERILEP
jgi:hypothetical protein